MEGKSALHPNTLRRSDRRSEAAMLLASTAADLTHDITALHGSTPRGTPPHNDHFLRLPYTAVDEGHVPVLSVPSYSS